MTTEPTPDRPKFNPRTYQRFWQLLDEVKPAHDRYRRALRKAEATATDSPENLDAQAKGNTALAEMEAAIRSWVAATACTCPRLAIGMEVTEVRDWSRGCPEHGIYSTWWNSPEQQAKREAQRAESAALQAKAKEMRLAALAARTGQEG